MSDTGVTFKAPAKVASLPPRPARGGKTSLAPQLTAWLDQLPADGEAYELLSDEKEPGHASNRVQQLKALATERFPETGDVKVSVETRTLVPNKRYRVFAIKSAVTNGEAETAAKASGRRKP